jgi:hypothetical protein
VGIAAPAGNCVDTTGATCLRSIDTTINSGLTTPGSNTYTNETNPNLGTSFSAPIVSGVAALMRAVNANLTPPQLIARLKASASPFPQPAGTSVCSTSTSSSVECACTTTTCGAGMVNAFHAVQAALDPIAAVKIPTGLTVNGAAGSFDASGSVAACNVAGALTFAWVGTGGVVVQSGAAAAQVVVRWTGAGTLTVTVTDSAGNSDIATVNFTATTVASAAPSSAGTAATACPTPLNFTVTPPGIAAAFSPSTVAVNVAATLLLTLSNANDFALTQTVLSQTLPADLTITGTPTTNCRGGQMSLSNTNSSITLTGANIPQLGSCTVTLSVQSATAATYTIAIAANTLSTGPAGSNTDATTASLDVTAAAGGTGGSSTGSGHGGGEIDWLDIMFVTGVLLASRRHVGRRARP